jgi:hypothetical protein
MPAGKLRRDNRPASPTYGFRADAPELVDVCARRRDEPDVQTSPHRVRRVGGAEREVVRLGVVIVAASGSS